MPSLREKKSLLGRINYMNLPHIHEENTPAIGRAALGSKSLKAFSRPLQARSRVTNPVVSSVGMTSGLEEYAVLPNPTASWKTLETQRKHLLELAIFQACLILPWTYRRKSIKACTTSVRVSVTPALFLTENRAPLTATKAFIRANGYLLRKLQIPYRF